MPTCQPYTFISNKDSQYRPSPTEEQEYKDDEQDDEEETDDHEQYDPPRHTITASVRGGQLCCYRGERLTSGGRWRLKHAPIELQ